MRSKRLIQRGFALLSSLVILISSLPITASAWGRNPTMVSAEEAKSAANEDWRTYTQTDPRWGGIYVGGQTCHAFGCQATTEAALMKATGMMPDDWSPYDYMMYLNSIGSPAGIQGYPLNPFDEVKQYVAYDETKCKEALDAGCYVELRVGGATNCPPNGWGGYDGLCDSDFHSIYVTGYDSEGIMFGETWDAGDRWASGIENGLGRKYEKLYVNKECVSFNGDGFKATLNPGGMRIMVCKASAFDNEKAIAGQQGGGDFSGKSEKKEMTVEGLQWLEEQDFLENEIPCLYDAPIGAKLPGFDSLDTKDRIAVEGWKDDIDGQNSSVFIKILRAVVVVLGISLVIYGVVLYLAYQFDMVNNFVDIELLSILSLGRLKASKEYIGGSNVSSKSKGGKVVNHVYMIKVCLLTITVGVLLVSGYIYRVLQWILIFIEQKLLSK